MILTHFYHYDGVMLSYCAYICVCVCDVYVDITRTVAYNQLDGAVVLNLTQNFPELAVL